MVTIILCEKKDRKSYIINIVSKYLQDGAKMRCVPHNIIRIEFQRSHKINITLKKTYRLEYR